MKKILPLALALASTSAMAQLPNGSVCPNFTGTDLDGNTHTLYDYLDQGYTVVIDVSATWCGPCWNYHNTGSLENLYDMYGPGTAEDRVMVFFIEGDGTTGQADLEGNTGASQGDWIAGTPYPIIDDASIANLLEITYFPTIYTVCPSRIITESGQISTAQHWNIANDCGVAVQGNNMGVVTYNSSSVVCGNATMEVTIQNLGTTAQTSCDLAVKENGNTIATQSWSGNLSTYGMDEVTFNNVAVTDPEGITVEIVTADIESSDNVLDPGLMAIEEATTTLLTVSVLTDSYGAETYWRVINSWGTEVASGGNILVGTDNHSTTNPAPNHPSAYANNTTYNVDFVASTNECYILEVYDFYGDGICCQYGPGSFKLKHKWGGNIIAQGGEFGESDARGFRTTDAVGVNEIAQDGTSIYPNPTNGLVNITFGTATDLAGVDVYNVLGERVMSRTMNTSGVQVLDLSGLNNGLYYFNVNADGKTTTHKVTLNR